MPRLWYACLNSPWRRYFCDNKLSAKKKCRDVVVPLTITENQFKEIRYLLHYHPIQRGLCTAHYITLGIPRSDYIMAHTYRSRGSWASLTKRSVLSYRILNKMYKHPSHNRAWHHFAHSTKINCAAHTGLKCEDPIHQFTTSGHVLLKFGFHSHEFKPWSCSWSVKYHSRITCLSESKMSY